MFLLLFVWLRYVTKKFVLSLVLSAAISLVIYGIFFFYNRNKTNKTNLKIKEKEDAENMFLSLCLSDDAMVFFENLAKKKHENVTKKKEYIIISHPEKVKTILFADLNMAGVTVPRFMEIYSKVKKEKATKIVICCKDIADKMLFSFLENFKEKILILNEYETYRRLYKYYDTFPPITTYKTKEKKVMFKDFLAYSFNKKRTKGYLFSAIVLIISGLFIPTTIYYCVIASILVVFALLSQFNPVFNKQDAEIF